MIREVFIKELIISQRAIGISGSVIFILLFYNIDVIEDQLVKYL